MAISLLLPTALPLEEIKGQVEKEIAFLIREGLLKKQKEAVAVVARIQEEEDARRKRNNALIYLIIMALSDE